MGALPSVVILSMGLLRCRCYFIDTLIYRLHNSQSKMLFDFCSFSPINNIPCRLQSMMFLGQFVLFRFGMVFILFHYAFVLNLQYFSTVVISLTEYGLVQLRRPLPLWDAALVDFLPIYEAID